jgi:hypothetical protein
MTAHSDAVRHERGDIQTRPILWGASAIAAAIVLVAVFAWLLIGGMQGDPNGANSVPAFRTEGPRLQTDAPRALESYQATKQKILNSRGWTDEQPRRVRIPIERAMQLLVAQRGQPAPQKEQR